MTFLAPWWVPVIAAGMAVPPLVLLYFLKLKRREVPIASTLLWKRAVQDLQVNSPFQRLRNNLLLILQLLILALAIFAMCEPMWAGRRGEGTVSVLLIDRSASMGASEGADGTRLDIARREAHKFVDNLRPEDRAMIITFADRANVIAALTDDKQRLHKALDSISQSDAPGRLAEAMQLAEAPSSEVGEGPRQEDENPLKSAEYVLFTDGRLADTADVRVQRGSLSIVRVGEANENAGIVTLDVRRSYEQPEQVSILAHVRNFGATKQTRDLSLLVDDQLQGVRTVELAPMAIGSRLPRMTHEDAVDEQSEATVAFDLPLPTAARLELRLSGQDALAVDDRAWAVVAPPRPIEALLVTSGNRYLRQMMTALPFERHEVWTPDEYENAPEEKLVEDGRARFDLVIFDMHATRRLPPGNYLFFGAVPLIDGVDQEDPVEGQVFLDWDETHPILRHVPVEAMNVFSWYKLSLPREAETLIEAGSGPVLSLLRRERNQYLISAFGLFDSTRSHLNTTWIFDEGFVVFMYQAVRYLTGSTTIGQQPPVAPGQAFTVAARPGTTSVTVRRPDGTADAARVSVSGVATYGRTDRVGLYGVETGIPGEDARAVNLVNKQESFIAPNAEFRIAAGELVQARESVDRVNRPLWPWVLAALGGVLLLEWIIYNKRVFI